MGAGGTDKQQQRNLLQGNWADSRNSVSVSYTHLTADYPIGELCAKLHGRLEISDTQNARPWAAGTVTLPAKINGISTRCV